jgi:cell division protein ZapA
MADKSSLLHVEIFGQTYAVKAGTDPEYLRRLAAYVDEQMREVSRGTGAVDSLKIAVLAALNIADECFTARSSGDGASREQDARALELAAELDEVLQG